MVRGERVIPNRAVIENGWNVGENDGRGRIVTGDASGEALDDGGMRNTFGETFIKDS